MTTKRTTTENYCTRHEAAASTGFSERTIDRLIARGQVRVMRVAGVRAVRVEKASLDRLIARSTTGVLE